MRLRRIGKRTLGFMKAGLRGSNLHFCCALLIGAGVVKGEDQFVGEPVYAGRPLSSWIEQVAALSHLSKVVNTNYAEVRAVWTIGTKAIPWLMSEMRKRSPTEAGDEHAYFHQLRARAGFWALGEKGAAAIPRLLDLLEQQPEWVPSALAGIGPPALPALERCLTNAPHYVPPSLISKMPQERAVVSVLGGLFVAINVGRISSSDAMYLLPAVRLWAKDTNREAAYWADGVLRELGEEQ
jgi:hypothetical protein